MPRVIKHPEVRRAEILDAALGMFLERGYDNTSLNELIVEAGLSKGMFYHHFASKDDLLAALFERITDETHQALEPVLIATDVDAKSRLQQVMDRAVDIRMRNAGVTRSLYASLLRPESKLLFDGIMEAWIARMRPVLTRLVEDGVATSVFETPDAEGAADLILRLGESVKYLIDRGMGAETVRARNVVAKALALRLRFHAVVIARSLGLPDDTFSIGPPDFARRFLEALNPLRPDPPVKAVSRGRTADRSSTGAGSRPRSPRRPPRPPRR